MIYAYLYPFLIKNQTSTLWHHNPSSIRQAKQINRHPCTDHSKSPSQPLQILWQTIKHHRSRRRHHNTRKPLGIARYGAVALPVTHKLAKELVVDEPKMKALWATRPAACGEQYKRRSRHHRQQRPYESQHKKYPTDNQKRPTYGWAGWLVGFRPVIKGFFFGHSWASGRSDRWCGHVFYTCVLYRIWPRVSHLECRIRYQRTR